MSQFLDNKSDAEIEDIYRQISFEDLEDMLSQERNINRRRILRRVIRTYETGSSEKLTSAPEVIKDHNEGILEAKSTDGKITGISKTEENQFTETLEELKLKLQNTVDLTDRKVLRKEIQDIEEKFRVFQDSYKDKTESECKKSIVHQGKDFTDNSKNNNKETPATIEIQNLKNSDPNNQPVKSNMEKSNDFSLATAKESSHQSTLVNNKNLSNSTGLLNHNSEQKLLTNDHLSPNKNVLEHKNNLSQGVLKTADIPSRKTVSRVSSVKEMFENNIKGAHPNVVMRTNPTKELKTQTVVREQFDDKPSLKAREFKHLSFPEERTRAVSKPNIMVMVPQIKKMASHARSAVQLMKEQLIYFCQQNTKEYQNVSISNYSKSWADGLAFCALIHHFYPNSFDFNILQPKDKLYNFALAFNTAKDYAGIEPLLDPDDMIILENPDEKCVYTYVQHMYSTLKQHPKNVLGNNESNKK